MSLLDVGAGPGSITVDLAERVAPGAVTATEQTPRAMDLTRAEAVRCGIALSYAIEDVHALSFEADSFDVVHAHQVLQHVADPVQALRELARVCRPGGLVAVRDSDYGAFTWFPEPPELSEWMRLYLTAARANGGEPFAGRQLLSWARRAGLSDVVATASTWCYADDAGREFWGGMWADRILQSAMAEQLVRDGHATRSDLERISSGWRQWSAAEDGWFLVPHGEILVRV